MARSLWKGTVSFGLVTIPVGLFTAVREKSVHFHLLSEDGSCRLRRKLFCPETGEEYDFADTARGYEVAPDQYVIVTEEEFDRLKPESGRTIEIEEFVDLAAIDPIYFDRTYYLAPLESGAKPYRLLVRAMEEAGKVGLARFTMRQKEYLAAIRVKEGALMLETMHYAEEVVPAEDVEDLPGDVELDAKQTKVAVNLIEALSGPFEPEKYRNEYQETLRGLLEKKAEGDKLEVATSEERKPGKVIDLMDALEKSVEAAKKGKSPSKAATAKKTTAKKRKKA